MKEIASIGKFIATNRARTLAYLRNKFTQLSQQDTEDIYQDASIVLYKNESLGKLKSLTCELYTYFLRICINLSLKMVNKYQRMTLVAIGNEGCGSVPDGVLEQRMRFLEYDGYMVEQRENLAHAILGELSEESRRLMVSYYLEGNSWTDIAEKFGLSNANSAKSLACRCRRKLKGKYHELAQKLYGE